jgi:hypothetical protein
VHVDSPLPPEWGHIILVTIAPYHASEEWRDTLPGWSELVRFNDAGKLHHGSRGSLHADTIAIAVDGVIAAIADARHIGLDNLYAWDSEYYQYLRLRAVVDETAWRKLPWTSFEPGSVLMAWDKFHGVDYVRLPGDDEPTMSFGGSWSLLEEKVQAQDFPGELRPSQSAATHADLLAAVRSDRIDRVRELLASGVDPNGEAIVPPHSGQSLGVSHARDANLVWESVQCASPAVTEALLAAGARLSPAREGSLSALLGAILNRRDAHVPVLLRFGADPQDRYHGKTAIELADTRDPALGELLRAHGR